MDSGLPEKCPSQVWQRRVIRASRRSTIGRIATVEIRLLGPLSVTGLDEPTSLGPVQRRLLALLAVRAGSVVTTDQITDVLGLGSTGAVRTSVSRLRRVVGDAITRLPPGYVLDAGCLDVRRFEDLVRRSSRSEPGDRLKLLSEALGLWRGAALVEFADEEWARGKAARLDELRRNAAEDRIEALLALGRPAEATADAQALIVEHPLRERARGLQMMALAGQGRVAEALRSYQDFRQFLCGQTGLEPSTDLAELERLIVSGDIGRDQPARQGEPEPEIVLRSLLQGDGTSAHRPDDATSGPLGNLPRRRIELIGRRCELERLAALVAPGGLVTLIGSGGVGKTRLALHASATAAGAFADGAWLVELAAATVADDVLSVVVRRLGLFIASSSVSADSIARALGTQQRLVVLDNCEHVIEAVRALVDVVMGLCPQVSIVATSREALGCDGERLVAVPPLSLAADAGPSDAERLFRERVTSALGDLDSDDADGAASKEICSLLDGLPLALELAAARVGPLGLEEVRARIAGRRDALGRRRGIERHHSLATVVAWSYDLLSPEEQRVFERLAVFADGFDLAAAEAVCGWAPLTDPVEDHVLSLIDKSLVTVQRSTPIRYRLLEVVRQYADGRLSARGEAQPMADRLRAHFVEWTVRADAGSRGPDELHWHLQFEAEWNNLRTVVKRAIATSDIDAACHIVWRARWWAGERDYLELGEWADAVLAMPGAETHPLIPIVASASAATAQSRSEWAKCGQLLAEANEREKALGPAPEPWVAQTGVWLESYAIDADTLPATREMQLRSAGSAFWDAVASWSDALMPSTILGNSAGAPNEDHLRRVRRCVEAADDLGNPTCMARAADIQGNALRQAEPAEAMAILERGVAIGQSVGNMAVEAENRFDLALVYAEVGRSHDVVRMQRDAIRRYTRTGAWQPAWSMATATFRALVALDEHRVACLIVGKVREPSLPRAWYEHSIPPRLEAELEAKVGADEMARLIEQGRQLTVTALVSEVLQALDELEPPQMGGRDDPIHQSSW